MTLGAMWFTLFWLWSVHWDTLSREKQPGKSVGNYIMMEKQRGCRCTESLQTVAAIHPGTFAQSPDCGISIYVHSEHRLSSYFTPGTKLSSGVMQSSYMHSLGNIWGEIVFGLSFREVPDIGWEKKTEEKEKSNPDSENSWGKEGSRAGNSLSDFINCKYLRRTI